MIYRTNVIVCIENNYVLFVLGYLFMVIEVDASLVLAIIVEFKIALDIY